MESLDSGGGGVDLRGEKFELPDKIVITYWLDVGWGHEQ